MPSDAEQGSTAERAAGATLKEVSGALSRIYRDQYGHGPTRVRTQWAGPDALLCILDGTLAAEERTLVRLGGGKRLRDTRTSVHHAMVDVYGPPVERITGRTLQAFHSSCDVDAGGQSIEVFVFHPAGHDGPSRSDPPKPLG